MKPSMLRTALVLAVLAVSACGDPAEHTNSTDAEPPPRWPSVSENDCQGEACMATYAAVPCRDLELVAGPRNRTVVVDLRRGDTVDVRTDLLLEQPGLVVLERDVSVPDEWNSGTTLAPALRFSKGDTVHLLKYIGEGFWQAAYKGRRLEVLEFWGGPQPLTSADDTVRAADAMGTWPVIETWLRISRGGQVIGWWQDTSSTRTLRPIGEYGALLGFACEP